METVTRGDKGFVIKVGDLSGDGSADGLVSVDKTLKWPIEFGPSGQHSSVLITVLWTDICGEDPKEAN